MVNSLVSPCAVCHTNSQLCPHSSDILVFFFCLFVCFFLLLLFSVCQTFLSSFLGGVFILCEKQMRGRGRRVIISHIQLRHHPLLRAAHMHTNHLRGELKHNRGNECKWSGVNFALDLQMELIRRLDTHARPAV